MARKKKTDGPRIGVFVCHCGTNIAGSVDVEAVARAARKYKGVIFSTHQMFTCSEEGQEGIVDAVKEHGIERVVVASCSPRLHEATFRRTVESAGLNPFYLEMANLRENVAWVHSNDKEGATKKAKALVKAAVGRARKLEAIERKAVPVKRKVLVIGGGIAGIQAALDLSDMGINTVLVERSPTIGGLMARLVKTFPTGDCSMCILSPKMADLACRGNVKIITCAEVEDVQGQIGSFKVKIRQRPRFVDENRCTACGECAAKCPTKVKNEWDGNMGERTAIYTPIPQAVPRAYVIDPENCIKIIKDKCGACEKACPADAVDFDQRPRTRNMEFGTIIVATGADEKYPVELTEYGLGEFPNVITQLQLARMLDPSGPTSGRVLRPSDNRDPDTYLMIQCAGSRDINHLPYCSRVCCMVAVKHAMMILQEQNPDARIYIAYIDMRAFGKGYEEYYRRAREAGIMFLRGKVGQLEEDPGDGSLRTRMEDTDLGRLVDIKADLVVLSSGMVPTAGSDELARKLRIGIDGNGFVRERHPKLAPVDSTMDGIFVCGTAQGPKDIPDTVAQARAAATAAAAPVLRGKIILDLAKAISNSEICNGCGTCAMVCPYGAVELTQESSWKRVAQVIEALCKGCGTCVAECPTGAMELRHYKSEQIVALLDELLGREGG